MTKDANIQPSLVEQILKEMFVALEGQQEFDTLTIQKLITLAREGNLTKAKNVGVAIKSVLETTE